MRTEHDIQAAVTSVINEIIDELFTAIRIHKPLNSIHEAYAVIAEEVDELWDEVRKKRSCRSRSAMRTECVQIAAMAARTIIDVINVMPEKDAKRSRE